MRLFLTKANLDIDVEHKGFTALMIAAQQPGNDPMIQFLVNANANVNYVNGYGATPLSVACTWMHVKNVARLVDANANVNGVSYTDYNETTLVVPPMDCLERSGHNRALLQYMLHASGARGVPNQAKLKQMDRKISGAHKHLRNVLSKSVIVDKRIGLGENGLYHEPLERVMGYCGFAIDERRGPLLQEALGNSARHWFIELE